MSKTLIIHANDADQHLGRLQGILGKTLAEDRIDSFSSLNQDSVEAETFNDYGKQDLVILLLTFDLENRILNLINLALTKADLKVAVILIDEVSSPNIYTVLPKSKRPIRTEIDMDKSWNGIEEYLFEIYPKPIEPKAPTFWKKYKVYIIIALVLIVIFLLGPPEACSQDPEPAVEAVESRE